MEVISLRKTGIDKPEGQLQIQLLYCAGSGTLVDTFTTSYVLENQSLRFEANAELMIFKKLATILESGKGKVIFWSGLNILEVSELNCQPDVDVFSTTDA